MKVKDLIEVIDDAYIEIYVPTMEQSFTDSAALVAPDVCRVQSLEFFDNCEVYYLNAHEESNRTTVMSITIKG